MGTPSLYHWLPLIALLVNTIVGSPTHAITGLTGEITGVGIEAETVTAVVPGKIMLQPVIAFIASTVKVVLAVKAELMRFIEPPVPATNALTGVLPSNSL